MIKFQLTSPADHETWDKFVRENGGNVYQLYFWSKVLQDVYGYKPQYFFLQNADPGAKMRGIFPAVMRGRLSAKLVSLPFTDSAGWLTDPRLSSKEISDWLRKKEPNFEVYSEEEVGIPVYQVYARTVQDYDATFASYHPKTRNMVRKARKNFTGRVEVLSGQFVNRFAHYYQSTMKKVGTLTLTPALFRSVFQEGGEINRLSIAYSGSTIASFLWLFTFNQKLYVWANAYQDQYLTSGANYFVYDQAIKYACDHHYQEVIFGASQQDSSQGFFKDRWGALPKPVYLYSSKIVGAQTRWKLLKMTKPLFHFLPDPLHILLSDLTLRWLS